MENGKAAHLGAAFAFGWTKLEIANEGRTPPGSSSWADGKHGKNETDAAGGYGFPVTSSAGFPGFSVLSASFFTAWMRLKWIWTTRRPSVCVMVAW